MAEAENRPNLTPHPLIEKLVKDPAAPPEVTQLVGYLGRSNREGNVRLYFSLDLNEYADIPEEAVLHAESVPESEMEQGGTRLWVKAGSEIVSGGQQGTRMEARFLEGGIAAANLQEEEAYGYGYGEGYGEVERTVIRTVVPITRAVQCNIITVRPTCRRTVCPVRTCYTPACMPITVTRTNRCCPIPTPTPWEVTPGPGPFVGYGEEGGYGEGGQADTGDSGYGYGYGESFPVPPRTYNCLPPTRLPNCMTRAVTCMPTCPPKATCAPTCGKTCPPTCPPKPTCAPTCGRTCPPTCGPKPTCAPTCAKTCPPTCPPKPTCVPTCGRTCMPTCPPKPTCGPTCAPTCLPTRCPAGCRTLDPRCFPVPTPTPTPTPYGYGEGTGAGESGGSAEYGGYEGAGSAGSSGYGGGYPGYGWGDDSGNY